MRTLIFGFGALILLGCEDGGGSLGDPSAFPEGTAGSATGPVPSPPGGEVSGSGGSFAVGPDGGPTKGGFERPLSGATFIASRKLPPVSGGTLLVLENQTAAVVSDPDHDQLLVVNLAGPNVTAQLQLETGAEPGRAVQDATGRVHVVLRGSGQLASLDPVLGTLLGTRSLCRYPRGIAAQGELLHVACAEGRLLSLSSDPTQPALVRDLPLERDLRDVVATTDGLWLSRFRSAEVLRLDLEGAVVGRYQLPTVTNPVGNSVPDVAWRMIANTEASGGVIVVHQRAFAGEVVPSPGGYGSGPSGNGIVETAVSTIANDGTVMSSDSVIPNPLAVDIAQSGSGELLLASAAPSLLEFASMPRAQLLAKDTMNFQETPVGFGPFLSSDPAFMSTLAQPGNLVAVAFASGRPVMQFRDPSQLVVGTKGMNLPGEAVNDTGNTLFHMQTSSGLACASCHPEGQEDGHVWNFTGFGPRRTQSLRGGLKGTEPFHWDGLEQDFTALTGDVMAERMLGPSLTAEQVDVFANYLDTFAAMPAPPAAVVTPEVARGQELFNDPVVGCATCHSGQRFSNNLTVDVGAATPLQVPSLVGVWARSPFLHDGCAPTMLERFSAKCDNVKHGNISGLEQADVVALSAFVETL